MFGRKGQVATEYLLITGFILIAVTLIFAYAYISNNQNIMVSQANTSLDKMVNAADLVYALGPGNVQYIEVTFPRGIESIQDITLCEDGGQGHDQICDSYGAKLGAIEMTLELLGGNTAIIRGAKTELELDTVPEILPKAGTHRVKVEWCGNKICLKSA